MPIYEYQCRACECQFEALVRGTDVPSCPECHSTELDKLLSMFGVSSETTRKSNMKTERAIRSRVQRDKDIADHEAAHHAHDHDH